MYSSKNPQIGKTSMFQTIWKFRDKSSSNHTSHFKKSKTFNIVGYLRSSILEKFISGLLLPAFLFTVVIPVEEIFAQSTPQLNSTKQFRGEDLQPYVDSAKQSSDETSFMNILNGGEQAVEAAWEAAVDAEIQGIVDSVNTNDPVNDVNVYKDAVRAQLELQKQQSKSQWLADAANFIQTELQSFLNILSENKSENVTSSNTNAVNTIDPTVQNTVAAPAVQEVSPQQAADTYYQGVQLWDSKWQDLLAKQAAWEQNSLVSIQDGLNQWDSSIAKAQQEKIDFLAALDQQEELWKNNGTMIDAAEQSTRDYLASLVDSINSSMKTSMSGDNSQNAALQSAFAQAQDLIAQVQTLLSNGSPLDQIAKTLGEFFQNQEEFASERAAYWDDPAQKERYYTGYQSVQFNYYVGGYSATGSQKDYDLHYLNQRASNMQSFIDNGSCYDAERTLATVTFTTYYVCSSLKKSSGTFDAIVSFDTMGYGNRLVATANTQTISDSQLIGISFQSDGQLYSKQYTAVGGDCVAQDTILAGTTDYSSSCQASEIAGTPDTTTCEYLVEGTTSNIQIGTNAGAGGQNVFANVTKVTCGKFKDATSPVYNTANVTTSYTIDQNKLAQNQYLLGALNGTQFAENSGVYGNITSAINKVLLGGIGGSEITSLSQLGTDGNPVNLLLQTDYTFDDPNAIANRDEWGGLASIYSDLSSKLLAMVNPLKAWYDKNEEYKTEYQTKLTELQAVRVSAAEAFDNQIADLQRDRDVWVSSVYGYELPGYEGAIDNPYSQYRQGQMVWEDTITQFVQTELQWFLASKDTLQTAVQDPNAGELKFIQDGSQAIQTLKDQITGSEQNSNNLYNTANKLVDVYYYKGAADAIQQAISNKSSESQWNQNGADLSKSIRDSYARSEAYGTADLDASNRINQLVEMLYGSGSYAYDANDLGQIQTSVNGYASAQTFWQEEIDGNSNGFGFNERKAAADNSGNSYTDLLTDINQAASLQSVVMDQEKVLLKDVNDIFAQEKKYSDLSQTFASKGDFDTAEYYKGLAIKQQKLAQEKLTSGYGSLSAFAGDQVTANTLNYTKNSYIAYGLSLLGKGNMSANDVALEIRKNQDQEYALSQSGIDYKNIQEMISSSQQLLKQGDEQADKVKELIQRSEELANRSIGGELLAGLNDVLNYLSSQLPDEVTTAGISEVIAADSEKALEAEDTIASLLRDMDSLLTSPEDLKRLSELQQAAGTGVNLTANTAILTYLDGKAQEMEELNKQRSADAFDSLWEKIQNGADYQYLREAGYKFTQGANGTIVGVREINSGVYKVEGNAMADPTYTAIFVDQYLTIQTQFQPPALSLSQLSPIELASTGFNSDLVSSYMKDISAQEDNINLAYEQFSDKSEYLKAYSDANEEERIANEKYYEDSRTGVLVTYNGLQDTFQKDQKIQGAPAAEVPVQKDAKNARFSSLTNSSGSTIRVNIGVGTEGSQLQDLAISNQSIVKEAETTQQETVQKGFDSIMSDYKDNLKLYGYEFKTDGEEYKGVWKLVGSVTVSGIPIDMTYGQEEITLPTTFHLENLGFNFGFSGVGEAYTGQKLQEVYQTYSDYLQGIIKDIQTRQAQNQADADQKKLLFDVASGMVGGNSLQESAQSVYQDRVTGAIAEATGLPASFVGALVGGGSMGDAVKAYIQDQTTQAISEATGIPAWVISGELAKRSQPKEQWYQSQEFQMATTVVAVAAAPFTGGTSLYMAMAMNASIGAATGAAQGGAMGALVGAAGGALQAYTKSLSGGAVGVNLSYSSENGFGASVGVGYGPMAATVGVSQNGGTTASLGFQYGAFNGGLNYNSKTGDLSGNVGVQTENGANFALSYSQQSGVGVNAGLNSDKYGVGGNLSWSQGDGFGGGLSYGVPSDDGKNKWGGTGANISWSEYGSTSVNITAAGGSKGGNNASQYGSGGVTAGTWTQGQGFAANTNFLDEKWAQDYLENAGKTEMEATDPLSKAQQDQANDMQTRGTQNLEAAGYEVTRKETNLLDDAIDAVFGERSSGDGDANKNISSKIDDINDRLISLDRELRFGDSVAGPAVGQPRDPADIQREIATLTAQKDQLSGNSATGTKQLTDADKAAFWEGFRSESRAETDATIKILKDELGYDTSQLESQVKANREARDAAANATPTAPKDTPWYLGIGITPEFGSAINSVVDGAKSWLGIGSSKTSGSSEYTILNPHVDQTIHYGGSDNKVKGVPAATDDPVKIKIVSGNFDNDTTQWVNMKDFSNKLHYQTSKENLEKGVPQGANDTKYKVDLDGNYGNKDLTWFGPNAKFRVDGVFVGEAVSGSRIQISILDQNNQPVGQLNLKHFNQINASIYNGIGKTFSAGTYLGSTSEKVGLSIGKHLHVEVTDEWVKNGKKDGVTYTRGDIYNWMKGD